MADAHKNFACSLVATAPSPATSGTSLVVTAGEGTKFPAAPFNATIWPAASNPTTATAEIVRVTAVSTDTLTITRTQEGTSARTVIVGDQIVAGITAKTLTDAEGISGALPGGSFASGTYNFGQFTSTTWGTSALTLNRLYAAPFPVSYATTFDRIAASVTTGGTAGAVLRLGIYTDSAGQPGTLVLDAGTAASTSVADVAITISQALAAGLYWLVAVPQTAACTIRAWSTNQVTPWFSQGTSLNGIVSSPAMNSITGALPGTWTPAGSNQTMPVLALRAA